MIHTRRVIERVSGQISKRLLGRFSSWFLFVKADFIRSSKRLSESNTKHFSKQSVNVQKLNYV